MTKDEMRQQKAMLLLEHQEATERFAHLREKAKRISNRILAVQKWISDASEGYNLDRDSVYLTEVHGEVKILTDPEVAKAMDFDAVKQLFHEIQDAKATVVELQKRKEALGLK